ncbi:NAD(P)-dependent oxidoreductase [Myxococcus landrumensis]|uniref:NAD(P)-dependent oxidoreductase n=1 Tax=Myxococcus landrumensis TaxID=2813577 RepID=A0ABX7NFY5_9BACT|nr:NAD(P)-binding domain-containing protein [Myxococcus landrumus]QSQ17729.1 NAD(P)-dependent oxidoreductase [Myxococcus landrumus]
MKPTLTVIGAGRMGSALIKAFLQKGYTTTVWNRTRSRSEPLAKLGAHLADTVRDAVKRSDIIVVNVLDYDTSDQLLRQDEVTRELRGKLLVQLTSGSPALAREQETWARQHGIDYLDGAIMATPDFIGQAECALLYSGSAALFEKHRAVLNVLGGATAHVGEDVGHASALDSALLFQMWGTLFGTLQALAISRAEGIPLEKTTAFLKLTEPVTQGAVTDLLTRVQQDRLTADEHTLASLEAHNVAFQHLLALCKERNIHRGVADAMYSVIHDAVKAGHGKDDFAILTRFLK